MFSTKEVRVQQCKISLEICVVTDIQSHSIDQLLTWMFQLRWILLSHTKSACELSWHPSAAILRHVVTVQQCKISSGMRRLSTPDGASLTDSDAMEIARCALGIFPKVDDHSDEEARSGAGEHTRILRFDRDAFNEPRLALPRCPSDRERSVDKINETETGIMRPLAFGPEAARQAQEMLSRFCFASRANLGNWLSGLSSSMDLPQLSLSKC
eukprot:s611_g16.t1